MTPLEAKGAIQNAIDKGDLLEWDLAHSKSRKSKPRYEHYKTFTTFEEVKKAIANKKMLMGDLVYDIQRGICKLVKPQQQAENPAKGDTGVVEDVDHIEAIEASIACLSEVIKSANEDVGPIERLYDLRTRMENEKDIEPDSWKAKLISTLHMACVMGWDDKGTQQAMNEFALSTINEVICGKITPLTLSEAKALPEWTTWKESMVKEFKALREMGVFELVKRTDLPKRARVVKTKWVYKIKQNDDGSISKYKPRLVAQGFLLRWGIDYYDTYSSGRL